MKLKKTIMENKTYILWGKTRHIYEFTYMFDFLKIRGCILTDTNNQYNIILDKYTITDLEQKFPEDFILVICDTEVDEYTALLNKYGLADKISYMQFEELFEYIDPFTDDILDNRKIAVWGTGETEKNFQSACKNNGYNINIELYIDNNIEKKNTIYCGHPIKPLSEIDNIEEYFIIIASIYYHDIKKDLDKFGLQEGKDYLSFSCFLSKPSAMLKEQVHSKELTDFYCNRPYTWFYYAWFGSFSCCSTWVKYPIGNPASDSPEQCWNSTVAKLYRLSADTRTYCFCKKDACGIMNRGKLNQKKVTVYTVPEKITLGLDYTCNLHCASCRDYTQVASGEQLRIRQKFADDIIQTGWLEKTKELELSGSGEALFSKIDRKILFSNETCKRNSISLMSNGILLNEENLQKLRQHFKNIRLNISIDAATESTYNVLRRGGDWHVLMNNLENICNMRQMNEIDYVEIRMVVQKKNYKEMPDFVRLGKKYQVDKVVFTKLLNWDMYSDEEYFEQAMLTKEGIIKGELKKILMMEIFKEQIVVISEFKKFIE